MRKAIITPLNLLFSRLSQKEESAQVRNPYKDERKLANLRVYLSYLRRNRVDVFLIGEAPGYKGCMETGIPFTSSQIINCHSNPFFKDNRADLYTATNLKENTATTMWRTIGDIKPLPLLWNGFPFHPHNVGDPNTNRTPNKPELLEGQQYLRLLYDIYRPQIVISIGRSALTATSLALPGVPVSIVRHPSYGGVGEFRNGLMNVLEKGNSYTGP